MSSPQDARARHREKKRRAKKNQQWLANRAQENAAQGAPKAAKTAT
jgi:hypothetical protein